MGLFFSAPTLYELPVITRFRCNSFGSKMTEVFLLLTLAVIPFLVGWYSGDFWKDRGIFTHDPNVGYTGRAMMRAVTTSGEEYLWTSSDQVMSLLRDDPRYAAPFFSAYSDDKNRDGRPDTFHFTFRIPKRDPSHVFESFEFLPTFHYAIMHSKLTVRMESAAFVSKTMVNQQRAGKLVLDGFLQWQQLKPISADSNFRYDRVYQRSYFDEVRDISDVVGIGNYARRYLARNESTPFVPTAEYLTNEGTSAAVSPRLPMSVAAVAPAATARTHFTVSMTLRVQPATVHFVPHLSETVKFAWIQYFCVAYVLQWVLSGVRSVIVTQAWVNTIAIFEGRYRE